MVKAFAGNATGQTNCRKCGGAFVVRGGGIRCHICGIAKGEGPADLGIKARRVIDSRMHIGTPQPSMTHHERAERRRLARAAALAPETVSEPKAIVVRKRKTDEGK